LKTPVGDLLLPLFLKCLHIYDRELLEYGSCYGIVFKGKILA
jgi:hypothetical protein